MPIDHFSLVVPASKVDGLAAFLVESLQHMGFKEHVRVGPNTVGMGDIKAYFWLAGIGADEMDERTMANNLGKQHFAFTAESRSRLIDPYHMPYGSSAHIDQVQQFYDAARKAGAADNGPPGYRPQYSPGYYGAFVRDPFCGVNFEVVYHDQGSGSLST